MRNLFEKPKRDANEQEKLEWLRLSRTENVGPITFYKLIDRYQTAAKALEALPELAKKGGRKHPLIAPPMDAIEKEYNRLRKIGGDLVCAHEKNYPLALAATDDAPPVLSYLGHIDMVKPPCLGIVGARNASLNGRKFTYKLAKDLGEAGQIIVSGLARGIDTAAHEGALKTGTIAVVAGGIDVVYPRENQKLYEEIIDHGLILAESPLGMQPIARHFPKRNRIVSGISSGILVMEATVKSGSLITARMSAEQGRDVYAVPGYPLDPRAQGPNKLIQDGAILVQRADDILKKLIDFSGGNSLNDNNFQPICASENISSYDESQGESIKESILENMSQLPVGIDELARACHVSIPALQMAMLELELAGRLNRLPGNRVVLLDE